ncbi:hypothetical protein [Paraflavitalea speifideaquila]|uniref:hypothetical protein n=1 Tax=Paraflavitalea speifideaquila TaxID=3076558 RepID=UPI0028ECF11D|nr:hypothetical protein [Paraflavitalea speifideiaquila]
MKEDKASRTAQYMALFRALETARPQGSRLFNDPYAISFLDRGLKRATQLSKIPFSEPSFKRSFTVKYRVHFLLA